MALDKECPYSDRRPCHECDDIDCMLHTSNAHERVTLTVDGEPKYHMHTSLYCAIHERGTWEHAWRDAKDTETYHIWNASLDGLAALDSWGD